MLALAFAACGGSSAPPPANRATVEPAAHAPERRCLPVVAKQCGCVYACGEGERAGARWRVKHAFWKPIELTADIATWCADATCTNAFTADIVCDGICVPKPADPTCRFDAAGACHGSSP